MGIGWAQATDCPYCGGTGLIMFRPIDCRGCGHVLPSTPDYAVCHGQVCVCGVDDKFEPGEMFGGQKHEPIRLVLDGRVAWVDRGVADDVARLWERGIETWVSCEGSPDRYISILDVSRKDEAADLLPWVTQVSWSESGARLGGA